MITELNILKSIRMALKKNRAFYESFRLTLFACRVVGILPISGLLRNVSEDARIVFLTPYTLYYGMSLFLLSAVCGMHFYDSIQDLRKFKDLGGLMVQCIVVLTIMMLVRFTVNWKKMLKKIEDHERLLPPLQHPERVFTNINRIMFCFLFTGIVEHCVVVLYSCRIILSCNIIHDDPNPAKSYYSLYYRWFFEIIPFNYGTAFILQFVILQTVFIFNLVNAIVIVITLYLVYRFRNFNRLMKIRQKECHRNTHTQWSDLQAHYTRLSRLVKLIDDHINPFVFITFLANVITICKQIYDSIVKYHNNANKDSLSTCGIDNSSDPVSVLRFLITTIYQMSKSIIVSTVLAHLHTLSRKPLIALLTVPASAYNLELQRFMDQVYHSNISLSGLQLFCVNQGTILSMLSTIITYELVLLQLPIVYGK